MYVQMNVLTKLRCLCNCLFLFYACCHYRELSTLTLNRFIQLSSLYAIVFFLTNVLKPCTF